MEAINVLMRNVPPLTYEVLKRVMEEHTHDVNLKLHSFEMNAPKAMSLNEADVLIIHFGKDARKEWKYLKHLRAQHPEIPVLLWGPSALEVLRTALEYGVQGLITDAISLETVIQAVRRLASGGKYFDQDLMIELTSSNSVLSKREVLLLRYVAQEWSRAAIAKQLSLSVRTVDLMLKAVRAKIGVRSNIGLALYAMKSGLV